MRRPGRTVVVGPVGDSSGCPLIEFVQRLTLDAIEILRKEYEAIAADLGGQYQGWSLAWNVNQRPQEDA